MLFLLTSAFLRGHDDIVLAGKVLQPSCTIVQVYAYSKMGWTLSSAQSRNSPTVNGGIVLFRECGIEPR